MKKTWGRQHVSQQWQLTFNAIEWKFKSMTAINMSAVCTYKGVLYQTEWPFREHAKIKIMVRVFHHNKTKLYTVDSSLKRNRDKSTSNWRTHIVRYDVNKNSWCIYIPLSNILDNQTLLIKWKNAWIQIESIFNEACMLCKNQIIAKITTTKNRVQISVVFFFLFHSILINRIERVRNVTFQ